MGVIFDLDQTIIDSRIAYRERINRNWQEVYALIPRMRPYQSVVDLIKTMVDDGIEVAIVTSSPRPYCQRILDFLGITGVITVCYHDTEKHKPDSEPILQAISKMKNQEKKQIIAVGDEEKDIVAANRAGVISVLGCWGNQSIRHNWNKDIVPDVECYDVESFLQYINTTDFI